MLSVLFAIAHAVVTAVSVVMRGRTVWWAGGTCIGEA